MSKRVYRIMPDGTVYGLWHDCLSHCNKARMKVDRVSVVEFDPVRKKWYVQFLSPFQDLNDTVEVGYSKREDALAYEQIRLNNAMATASDRCL